MYNEDLVSVIIPVYNAKKYIEECILSVLRQTFSNLEILVIDDCSIDDSSELIKRIAQEDSRIRYTRMEENSGAAVARNKGLELARGRYIAFLDSDDVWKIDKLEKEVSLIKMTNAPLVFGAIEMINESGSIIKGKRKVPNKMTYKKLLKNTAIATSTVLIDREVTGDFRMPLIRSGQDYATWLMILRITNGTAFSVGDVVASYRRTEGSLSSKKTSNWKKVYKIQVQYEKICPAFAFINCIFYVLNALKKYFF